MSKHLCQKSFAESHGLSEMGPLVKAGAMSEHPPSLELEAPYAKHGHMEVWLMCRQPERRPSQERVSIDKHRLLKLRGLFQYL